MLRAATRGCANLRNSPFRVLPSGRRWINGSYIIEQLSHSVAADASLIGLIVVIQHDHTVTAEYAHDRSESVRTPRGPRQPAHRNLSNPSVDAFDPGVGFDKN